jgi:hypothetical protein
MNIYDETTGEDVTFSYDSGFMLYASLEVARPIANGRMAPAPASLPVLTGVCVASAAYLERPSKAGYFIFPDLSVRHEGWYRIKFSLFEQMKHAYDADPTHPWKETSKQADPSQPIAHESMANRMEVVSKPFQVFSAKKFPGLSQSTELSKVVADQGCRVRIRREIRQRRGPSEKDGAPEPRRETPESYMHGHSRAASRNSMDNHYSPVDPVRRTSIESVYQQHMPGSRAPSITSMPQASPTTPSAYPTSAMLPPMQKSWDQAPSYKAPPPQARQSYYQPASPAASAYQEPVSWPPISTSTSSLPAPPSRYYSLPQPSASKRTCNRTWDESYGHGLKSGARPNQPRPLEPIMSHGIIEADNNDEDDVETNKGDYFYSRANGSRGLKVAQLLI